MTCCIIRPNRTYVAIFEYEATKLGEISLKKGDLLRKIKNENDDWMQIENISDGEEGLIPINHVAKFGTLEAEDWFFKDFSRQDAISYLLSTNNPKKGTFLVRSADNKSNHHRYSLSVVDCKANSFFVNHYRIKTYRGNFFINQNCQFPTLYDLIAFYRKNSLKYPCKKIKPVVYQEWAIDRNEIVLGTGLGEGNFGKVFQGTWRNKRIAVKTLKKGSMDPQKFLEEADIMKRIRHKNLVALYGVCTDIEPYYIIQEFMTNGSLLDCLHNRPYDFKYEDLVYISMQVASGMSYLENKQLIHRDLAARNVLIGEKKVAKICDFGLAKLIKEQIYEASTVILQPVRWTAPEALLKNQYSIKSDVWSFGILLSEIFSYGTKPYHELQNLEDVKKQIIETNYRLPKPVNNVFVVPDKTYEIMLSCWKENSQERPTFERLKNYFSGEENDVEYDEYIVSSNNGIQ